MRVQLNHKVAAVLLPARMVIMMLGVQGHLRHECKTASEVSKAVAALDAGLFIDESPAVGPDERIV